MKRLNRVLKTSFNYIKRNHGLAFSTIIIVFITFFITTLFSLLFLGSQYVFKALEQQLGLTLFFDPAIEEQEILDLKATLEADNPQLIIEYESKDDVYEEYVQIFGERASEFVTDDLLTPALRINSVDVQDVEIVYEKVTKDAALMDKIHSYIYFEQAIGVIKKAAQGIFWGGVGLSAFLLISSLIIIVVTTDISIANHAEEIQTMQLIGADKGYIRWPFVISGGFCSLFGSFLSVLVFSIAGYFVYKSLADHGFNAFLTERLFPGVTWPKFETWYIFAAAAGELVLGWFIGAVSSFISVKRRLKLS